MAEGEACVAGGCVAGGGRAWYTRPPHWQILRDTINERAVRILLECIIVHVRTNINFYFLVHPTSH